MSVRSFAAATYDSTMKAVTREGSVSADGLRIVIKQARRELKTSREIQPSEGAEFTILNQAQKDLASDNQKAHAFRTAQCYLSFFRRTHINALTCRLVILYQGKEPPSVSPLLRHLT